MTFWTAGVNAMCSNVVLGVIVLAVYGFLPVFSSEDCTSSASTIRVQTSCKQEDEDLMNAHKSKDNLDICRKMAAMFKCTVTSLPFCYDYFEVTTFNMYFHSPYSCELSPQQILELQTIHNRGAGVDVVDVSASAPVTKTPVSTPSDTNQDDEQTSPTKTIQGGTHVTLTNTKPGDDRAAITPVSSPSVTNQEVTRSGYDEREILANESGAKNGFKEEQSGVLLHNGGSLVEFSKFPAVLLMLWSRTLSCLLAS